MWMQLRRFTRFTNAFSGKLSHLKAVVATRVRGYLDGLQGILEISPAFASMANEARRGYR
jgi:hypothetical protein